MMPRHLKITRRTKMANQNELNFQTNSFLYRFDRNGHTACVLLGLNGGTTRWFVRNVQCAMLYWIEMLNRRSEILHCISFLGLATRAQNANNVNKWLLNITRVLFSLQRHRRARIKSAPFRFEAARDVRTLGESNAIPCVYSHMLLLLLLLNYAV